MSKFEQDNPLKVSGKFAKKWFVLKRNSVGYKPPNVSSWESFIICDMTGTRWLCTALFKNTHIPKFKCQLAFAFFAVVNHFRGPRRKQMFTSTASLQKVMVCDFWLVDFDTGFVCFCVSRFVACDRNYEWRQPKTQLWRRLLNFRVRVFLKSAIKVSSFIFQSLFPLLLFTW